MDEMQENGREALAQNIVGWARLRAEREARGMSLAEVSAHLKLAPRQIEAIERGDLSALPGMAFAKGFVRNYARFLQLDPVPFVALIDADDSREPSTLSSDVYSSNLGRMPATDGVRFSALPAALVVFALAAILGMGWHYHWFEPHEDGVLVAGEQSPPLAASSAVGEGASVPLSAESGVLAQSQPVAADSAVAVATASQVAAPVALASTPQARQSAPVVVQTVQSAPRAVVTTSAPAAQSAPARAAVSAPLAAPVKAAQSAPVVRPTQSAPAASAAAENLSRMVLSFDGDSWVEVHDASGKSVFSRLSQAGVVQEVQGSAPFTLLIGNAPKVKLTWKGRPVDLAPYTKGDVARLTLQ